MRAILTYHSIDDSGSPISVSPKAFDAHVRWLTSGAVRTLSLGDIQETAEAAENAVAVTFDDGFLNTRGAIERLLEAGIRPTLFVVTGHVGGNNDWGGRDQAGIPRLPLMTWDDLGRLAGRGLGIEAHSRSHPRLSGLSLTQLDDELGGCCEDLRNRLGVRSTCVAYPYGDVNADVASRAAKWFTSGVTVEMGALTDDSRPMLLPRLDMYYYRAAGAIESWGSVSFAVRLKSISLRRRLKAAVLDRNLHRKGTS
jgi:peptidoglycan/xylan/chitin deacetylase (PgdA/CDA1 family)